MKDFLNNQVRRELARGMAATLFLLICIQNLGSSIITALTGTKWAEADGQTRFLLCTSILVNFSGALIAFFRQKLTALVSRGSTVTVVETKPTS